MDCAPEIAATIDAWLQRFGCQEMAGMRSPPYRETPAPADPSATILALAALAAEAMARGRNLWVVTADDTWLPDISNAIDLRLRPLCLVLPGADYAGRIALRATLSLLKSRLTRSAEDSDGPVWTAMRRHLEDNDILWRSCLAWGKRGLDHEAPPEEITRLFPVCIIPWKVAETLAGSPDWVMLVQPGQLPSRFRTAWPGAARTVLLDTSSCDGNGSLVALDPVAHLRAELEVLGQELAEMELELATAQAELAAFTARYHELVAGRMAELDRIQADLARLRMERAPSDTAKSETYRQAHARAEQSRQECHANRDREAGGSGRFSPDTDLKKRFRQLAQKIHPDRAADEADRAWRTQLMSEANRAYRAGDAAALDEVLSLWLEGNHGNITSHAQAEVSLKDSLAAEVDRVRQRIAGIVSELDRLYGSRLYELYSAARLAERHGRDLLREMAVKIDNQIATAQGLLDEALAVDTA